MSKARWQLVCYDIADPKRLRRVHKFLKEEGIPLQYSVFLVRTTPTERQALLEKLQQFIDERQDDLRIYPISSTLEFIALGRQQLDPAMLLTAEGMIRLTPPPEADCLDKGNDST